MRLLKVKNLTSKLYMLVGDRLNVDWNGKVLLSQNIAKTMAVDKIEIYELDKEQGYKEGYAVFLGESL